MLNTLSDMFLKTGVLTFDVTRPQYPTDYLHEVLVPEACVLLIQEDYDGISFEEAKEIMEASNSFGAHLFPINEGL